MRFAHPELLKLLILIPILMALFFWFNKIAKKKLEQFASSSIIERLLSGARNSRRGWKFFISLLAITAVIVALARPQIGIAPRKVKRVGVDIVILLDTSLSMAAEDIAPNRLAKAKREIERLADAFEGNRLSLILFAGESAVECPLTLDVSTFKLFLSSISFNSISTGGTDISGALNKALTSLDSSNAKSKVILLITDGEDNQSDPLTIAKLAVDKKVRIYTVGLGSENGAPIPLRNRKGKLIGYKKDSNGGTVMTKQNSGSLRNMAEVTGGSFISSQGGLFQINPIIESIQQMEKSDITSTRFNSYIDRFQWLIGLALMLLFIELLL